ncbi:acyl carrier protein [uncultured Winogradskyella sp.]|uniref:acyl carrier protein n=1 Tax=Winogradskyella sp. 4-2091 TaxID=3381659 RepID=UPI0026180BD9|nr:acyl carrier protein [uncultured Winogradskyella sp.]
MSNYIAEFETLFRDVLENDDIVLTNETTAHDIEEWDSINHIYLVVEIEKHFKIKFSSSEILQWQNVGEMIQSVEAQK